MMRVEIRESAFEPLQALADYQDNLQDLHGKYGATASFIGTMRDFNEGDDVQGMVLEHYPGMTERYLEKMAADMLTRWSLLDVLIIHRVGQLWPNDPIVLVAVWSAHRSAAFEGCRAIMEALKAHAPFWKKEMLADEQQRWVSKNTAA